MNARYVKKSVKCLYKRISRRTHHKQLHIRNSLHCIYAVECNTHLNLPSETTRFLVGLSLWETASRRRHVDSYLTNASTGPVPDYYPTPYSSPAKNHCMEAFLQINSALTNSNIAYLNTKTQASGKQPIISQNKVRSLHCNCTNGNTKVLIFRGSGGGRRRLGEREATSWQVAAESYSRRRVATVC